MAVMKAVLRVAWMVELMADLTAETKAHLLVD
jgi:hypothetical protein